MSNIIETLGKITNPIGTRVYGTLCGGKRPRWYDLNEVNLFDGEIYGVSVAHGGIDGAGLILVDDIIEVEA